MHHSQKIVLGVSRLSSAPLALSLPPGPPPMTSLENLADSEANRRNRVSNASGSKRSTPPLIEPLGFSITLAYSFKCTFSGPVMSESVISLSALTTRGGQSGEDRRSVNSYRTVTCYPCSDWVPICLLLNSNHRPGFHALGRKSGGEVHEPQRIREIGSGGGAC